MLRHAAVLPLLGLALSTTAAAADLEPLAAPPVPADGSTASLVHLACAVCAPGGKVVVKSKQAEILQTTLQDGLLTVELTPLAAAEPGAVTLQVRGVTSRGKLNAKVDVPTAPVAGRIEITTSAAAVEPGDSPVTLTFRPPPSTQNPAAARYAVRASRGSVGPVTVAKDGTATAQWTPPKAARAPQRVVVGVVDLARPHDRFGATSIAVRVRTNLSYDVAPDSSNVLVLGDERVGPVQASPSGAVAFDVPLPPDLGSAVLETTTRQGDTSQTTVELPLGGGATHLVLPTPALLSADSRVPVPVTVVALQRDGSPATAPPSLEASRGSLGTPRPGRDAGVFVADWTAPMQTGTVEFTASQGDRRDTWQARLVESVPIVTLTVDPDPLPHDATRFTIAAGVGSPPESLARADLPRIESSTGKASGRARGSQGDWTLPMRIGAGDPGPTVQVVGPTPASDQPLAELLAWSAPPARPGDPAPVTVVALDAAGLPVTELPLQLAVPTGSGSLPPSATTDVSGVALLRYDLGDDATPSTLTISAGGHTLPLAILPGNQPAPAAGPQARRERLARWQQVAPLVHVQRKGAPAVAVVAAPPAPAAAPTPAPAAPASPADPAAAPAAAQPAAPAPAAKPARPARDGGGWARLGLDVGLNSLDYSMNAELGGVGPLDFSYENALYQGFRVQGRALVFFGDGAWGLDAHGGVMQVPYDGTFADGSFTELYGALGARYRKSLTGPLGFHVVGQVERTPAFLFLYEGGDPAAFDGFPYSVIGARLGAGLQVDAGPVYAEATVSETLAFAPVNLRVTGALEFALDDTWGLRLFGGWDTRTMAFEVAEEDVDVADSMLHLGVGGTVKLP